MNSNQEIFSAITGFSGSWGMGGASQDYDEKSLEEIKSLVSGTVENADLLDMNINHEEIDEDKIAKAIFDFHACDSGLSNNLDEILISLEQ
jgi:hypothetical protein